MIWFAPRRAVTVPPIEARAAAMGIPYEVAPAGSRWCCACGRLRPDSDVDLTRADLVICKEPAGCVAAAKRSGIWMA